MKRMEICLLVGAIILALITPFDLWGKEVFDALGRRMEVPNRPRRIISLAPSITEILYDLGLEELVIGVTRFSNYPPRARKKPIVGSYVNLNIEAIVSLNPDLILGTADGNRRDSVERLSEFGFPVYLVNPKTMDEIFGSMIKIGDLLDSRPRADLRVALLRKRVRQIREALLNRARPRVLLQLGLHPLVTCGQGTFQNSLIRMAGGINVAAEQRIRYPTYSIEEVLSKRPEVILVTSMGSPESLTQSLSFWHRWKGLPAVERGRIHLIEADLIDRPSPRIVRGLEEMALLIHPEIEEMIESEK